MNTRRGQRKEGIHEVNISSDDAEGKREVSPSSPDSVSGRHSCAEHLLEPEKGRFTFLACHFIHRSAVANAVAKGVGGQLELQKETVSRHIGHRHRVCGTGWNGGRRPSAPRASRRLAGERVQIGAALTDDGPLDLVPDNLGTIFQREGNRHILSLTRRTCSAETGSPLR